ncbi:MAG: DUF3943 domain-containing protein [Bacteroidetes bacterium]|nr:DUF3943 domain-containing protein [Bacteroidota bacterium]
MIINFTFKHLYRTCSYSYLILISLMLTSLSWSQTRNDDAVEKQSQRNSNQIFLSLSSTNKYSELKSNSGISLAINPNNPALKEKYFTLTDSIDVDYETWESKRHFWIAASELAIVQFIPFAMAKWGRTWDDPADNWANVSLESWWRNISYGWEYDGDAFLTNYFAHPYHGNLYFNVGRTNGYNFWESSAWAATGSMLWEYFGETFRPAINDWVNTTLNGITLGEVLYRLSAMLTDNTATGTNRVLREIGGALLNPLRGFNRLISGETGKLFPNPEDRKSKEYLVTVNAGIRSLDKDGEGDNFAKEHIEEGLFVFDMFYGNLFNENIKKPFSTFQLSLALSSGSPSLTRLQAYGNLFGQYLMNRKNTQHLLVATLDYNYFNNPGFIYGGTSVVPRLVSRFLIGESTRFITNIGIDLIAMGATPNDYFTDPEGRNYDFGPGIGIILRASIQNYIWDLVEIVYTSKWIYTQSEPARSRHHIHLLMISGQLPIRKYFAIGIGIGAYWRNSYYEDFPDIFRKNPVFRIFFKTALHY